MGGQKVKVKAQDAAMSGYRWRTKAVLPRSIGFAALPVLTEKAWSMWKVKGRPEGQGRDWSGISRAQPHGSGLEWWASPSRGAVITSPLLCIWLKIVLSLWRHYFFFFPGFNCWCWSGKSGICYGVFTITWETRIPFSPTQVQVYCQTVSDFCPYWKWPNKSNPSLHDYGQWNDYHFIKHTFTYGT